MEKGKKLTSESLVPAYYFNFIYVYNTSIHAAKTVLGGL